MLAEQQHLPGQREQGDDDDPAAQQQQVAVADRGRAPEHDQRAEREVGDDRPPGHGAGDHVPAAGVGGVAPRRADQDRVAGSIPDPEHPLRRPAMGQGDDLGERDQAEEAERGDHEHHPTAAAVGGQAVEQPDPAGEEPDVPRPGQDAGDGVLGPDRPEGVDDHREARGEQRHHQHPRVAEGGEPALEPLLLDRADAEGGEEERIGGEHRHQRHRGDRGGGPHPGEGGRGVAGGQEREGEGEQAPEPGPSHPPGARPARSSRT